MCHATLAGGKRLRALLLVGIVDALHGDMDNGMSAAAAVELIHAASLVVDDLPCMDNASHRRGQPALHRKIGESATVLAAFALINLAYEVLTTIRDVPAPTIVRLQSDLACAVGRTGLVAGQWDDLDLSQAPASHTSIALSKTAVLFEFASRCGGVLCGAEAADLRRLERFGRLFGLGYQMLDDLCDGESRRGDANGAGEEHSSRLLVIQRVIEFARASARGTAWQEVAGAFIRPAEQISRARSQEDTNGERRKRTSGWCEAHTDGTSASNGVEPAALAGVELLP
jgi:geranylgeranyl diphosphate synthase type II